MSHVYQPVMIRELLRRGGTASTEVIARALLAEDRAQVDYYRLIVRNMVGRVLTKNRKIVEREMDNYRLDGFGELTPKEISDLEAICDERIACYLEKREDPWSHRRKSTGYGLSKLVTKIEHSKFAFLQNAQDIVTTALDGSCASYPDLFRDLFKYLSGIDTRGTKPNRESQLFGRFSRSHASAQRNLQKAGAIMKQARITCVMPEGGIQDNTVNRLLLMSSSEEHLSNVPAAYFIEHGN